ncbi:hypothetical protein [Cognatilysobacter bugurensis]|uniref:hypothetical protein n=1 Tax=Cognatilysobacter bugurensis TaxID=543356 RepID=UPI001676097C|nr:hypothetical protein [Lysobacter bugurensis]
MVFAELHYEQHYSVEHEGIASVLSRSFPNVRSGLQGDSWIWITEHEHKVAVDTFTAMKHQVKSESPCTLVNRVLAALSRQYKMKVFTPPEPEAHEAS